MSLDCQWRNHTRYGYAPNCILILRLKYCLHRPHCINSWKCAGGTLQGSNPTVRERTTSVTILFCLKGNLILTYITTSYAILLYAQQFPTVPPPQGFPIQNNVTGFCHLTDYVKVWLLSLCVDFINRTLIRPQTSDL